MLLKVRDKAFNLTTLAGAVRSAELMGKGITGDTWDLLACMDRLIELGDLREITPPDVAGQDRIFVRPRH